MFQDRRDAGRGRVVATPADFMAVGQSYAGFDQVADDEAAAFLERS